MPRERAVSEVKEPHLISLKVLRLSRPSLSEQHPITVDTLSHRTPELKDASQHSHAYPSHPLENLFMLTPLLTLPPAFTSVFIGEIFSCCLSANNEAKSNVTHVKITAQMQIPSSQTLQLNLTAATDGGDVGTDLEPGDSLQKIVTYDLKEEGNHVLAVTVTYTDPRKPPPQDEDALDTRVRTFKKLYQFVAQQCIMVRTKAGSLPGGKAILEAQLENLGETPVALHRVSMKTKWKWTSLNWDMEDHRSATTTTASKGVIPLLKSRDVMQVAFLLEPDDGDGAAADADKGRKMGAAVTAEEKRPEERNPDIEKDVIGQLSIEWRTSCGDRGFLRTGKLVLPPPV
ncbi:hypothetical protein BDD12DRAFT_817740 [Trichophaea hybrida]|nr:hypothetical protein BDD12DRAFT_817740 [Trichophaea hybrida]